MSQKPRVQRPERVARSRSTPLEVEAKLLVTRERDFRFIGKLEAIGPYRLRRRDVVRLYSAYVDTPEWALARHGVALRLRRHGARWELTAKWAGRVTGLVHERPELTIPLSKAPRFPFRLESTLQPELDRIVAGRPLGPILVTQIHRRRIDVFPSVPSVAALRPLAELALDRVRLRAPNQPAAAARYCEIEIERLRGPRRHVIRVAKLLQRQFTLVPSTESKFARGLAVLYGMRSPLRRS